MASCNMPNRTGGWMLNKLYKKKSNFEAGGCQLAVTEGHGIFEVTEAIRRRRLSQFVVVEGHTLATNLVMVT